MTVFSHGHTLYEGEVRAPLILRLPGGKSAGKRLDEPVSLVDVFPTVLNFAEVRVPEQAEGIDLLPAAHGSGGLDPNRLIVVQKPDEEATGFAVCSGKHKLITGNQRPVVEQEPLLKSGNFVRGFESLLTMDGTPETRASLIVDGRISRGLRKDLQAWLRAARPAPEPKKLGDKASLDQIRSLGYVN